MKAKAISEPTPHLRWSNGSHTDMPDWTSARECAMASQMVDTLVEVRSLLFMLDHAGIIKDQNLEFLHSQVLQAVQHVVDVARGNKEPMLKPEGKLTFPIPPNFPKPPGFS